MNKLTEKTSLIVVDVQKAIDDPAMGERNNPQAEENIEKILKKWRKSNRPLFHIRHISKREDSVYHKNSAGAEIKEFAKPQKNEPLITKHFQSAFVKTNLEEKIKDKGIDTLVIVGFLTDQCVASTSEVANNAGYNVFLVSDATATIDCVGYNGKLYKAEDIHNIILGSLKRDSVNIIETKNLLNLI